MDWKIGQDRSTQIQENDPDLFDFNYEVQPIVDVSTVLALGFIE